MGDIPMQAQLRRFLYAKAARNRMPISGTFELTPRCNMNCRMCYIRLSEQQMRQRGRERTAEEWIALGRECAQRGMLFLLLTGGEPFLRKDFQQIYTELKKLGLLITINTNATLINEETVAWLRENAPAKVNVTIYGGSNETYQRLCGHPAGFDAATRAVDLLLEAGILVNINVSLTQHNLQDLPAIVQFGKSRGVQVNSTAYMFPPVRRQGEVDTQVRLSPEAAGDARALAEILTADEKLLERRLRALHAGCPGEPTEEECTRTADEKMGCTAGKSSFWVTWDGNMTPCGMMNQPAVRPFDTGFDSAWQALCGKADEIFLPPECGTCKMRLNCMICGALSMAEGAGDSRQKPEYLCRMTQAYMAQMEAEYGRRFCED